MGWLALPFGYRRTAPPCNTAGMNGECMLPEANFEGDVSVAAFFFYAVYLIDAIAEAGAGIKSDRCTIGFGFVKIRTFGIVVMAFSINGKHVITEIIPFVVIEVGFVLEEPGKTRVYTNCV